MVQPQRGNPTVDSDNASRWFIILSFYLQRPQTFTDPSFKQCCIQIRKTPRETFLTTLGHSISMLPSPLSCISKPGLPYMVGLTWIRHMNCATLWMPF